MPAGRDTTIPARVTHAVPGTPLRAPRPEGVDTLIVGMGCFWGAARLLWQLPSAYTTVVGSSGWHTPNPTYEETRTSMTGHTEGVLVVFDPEQVSLDDLLAAFWENTTRRRTWARATTSPVSTGRPSTPTPTSSSPRPRPVATGTRRTWTRPATGQSQPRSPRADQFFCAEDYAQQYLAANPRGCCIHGFCEPPTRDPTDFWEAQSSRHCWRLSRVAPRRRGVGGASGLALVTVCPGAWLRLDG
jgi:peptide-methionine (S)-S-oxide reductase